MSCFFAVNAIGPVTWRVSSEKAGRLWLSLGSHAVPLILVPNRRARRYVLRLRGDGSARVTIPRGGSAIEARRFAERNIPWLERQWHKNARKHQVPADWRLGCEILFRGERVVLKTAAEPGIVEFGTESLRVKDPAGDLRPEIEAYLRRLAVRELSARVHELATLHNVRVRRISVRNQRSRWGSCSCRGTVSLTWRLVQVPVLVCDYIILHELAHFKEMNHSSRFWCEVGRLCPQFGEAEAWLKAHADLLREPAHKP